MKPSLAHSPTKALRATAYFDALEQQQDPQQDTRQDAQPSSPTTAPLPLNRVNVENLPLSSRPVPLLSSDSDNDEARHAGQRQELGDIDDNDSPLFREAVVKDAVPLGGLFSLRHEIMARDSSVGGAGNLRQSTVDRCSPILEEDTSNKQIASEGQVVSPASGLESVSTESNKTVKWSTLSQSPGALEVPTPSYPFPPMNAALGSSPNEATPHAFHRPFTALSPTIPPPQLRAGESQAAKGRIIASRGMSAVPKVPPSLGDLGAGHLAQDQELDLSDVLLKLQSEPGLEKWWVNVSKVLRRDFGANRASLAVPSDSTDVENVPWAQMATFNAAMGDPISSSTTRGRQSTQSVHTDWSPQDDGLGDTSSEIHEKHLDPSRVASFDTGIIRPKLESRHSFAGFPQRLESMGPEHKYGAVASSSRPKASRTSSYVLLRGGLPMALESSQGTKLSLESLEQHMEQVGKAPHNPENMDDRGERRFPACILPVLQMLEMEPDPLLNSAGAVRVLERGKLVHVTREYEDVAEPLDHGTPARRKRHYERRTSWPTPGDKGNRTRTENFDRAPRSAAVLDTRSITRSRSYTSGSSKSIADFADKTQEAAERTSGALPYEDYEQTPPSPWSQSPAPSPAIHKEAEVNPFFVDLLVDEEAFSENPPPHDYAAAQIETIGVDRASSIVHVPLVHPLMSKPKRQPRLQEFSGSTSKKRALEAGPFPSIRGSYLEASQTSSDEDRKIPIAILSIMSSLVPYPRWLSSSLNILAPHFATSFYNARQHSDLEKQLAGVSHHKDDPTLQVERRGSNQQSDLATLDAFSPPSTESVTSASEDSGTSMHSPRGSNIGTPGWDSAGVGPNDELSFSRIQPELSQETNDNYFGSRKRYNSRRAMGVSPAILTTSTPSNFDSSSTSLNAELAHDKWIKFDQQQSPTTDSRTRAVPVASRTTLEANKGSKMQQENQASSIQPPAQHGERSQSEEIEERGPRGESFHDGDYVERQHTHPKRATLSTFNQAEERPRHHQRQLHTNGANFVATNPSLPAAAAKLPPDAPRGDLRGQREEDFTFLPPTSSMMRIMIDSGAIQEFIAEPVTGKINWANSRFQTYRNESAGLIRQKPWDNIHSDDQRSFHKLWKKALRTGDQVSHQARLRRFDGQYRWFHIRIVPIKNSYSSIKHWHGQAMDIHEQHTAEVNAAREKEKAASESKYRSLANSNPHIIFAASVPEGMTFANTQWLSYSGQDFDQALGFGFLDHVHPEDIIKCQFPAFTGAGLPRSTPSLTASVQVEKSPSSGHLSEVSAATDDTIKADTSTTSDDGTLSNAAEVLAPSGLLRDLASRGIIKASKDGQGRLSITTEMRLRSKSDQYRWHLVQGSLIESVNFGKGEAQWIIACADISDQKLIEEKLKDANTTLELETTRKMQFLSTMSHEIRTPLNGIIGNLQFLLNSDLDDYQSEWTYGADAAARGMHDLINDILDVSKAEAKMLTLYYDWFHIRSIIEDVFETLASKANEKRLELCYFVEKHVPSYVKGDAGRIRQVLLNLVSNAIKFTQRGEIFVNCMVKNNFGDESGRLGDPEDIDLLVSVQDTGSGFTEDDAKILFRPYSQIDNSSTRTNGGTGLGLLLCKQMVELHHGTISATSTPGQGSTFSFTARFKLPTANDRPKIPRHPSSDETSSLSTQEKKHFFGRVYVTSPGELSIGEDTPAESSGSSELSGTSSLRAARRSMKSSASSMDSVGRIASLNLSLPSKQLSTDKGDSSEPAALTPEALHPPIYSILIVCPQEHTRRTTEAHIQQILPKSIPAQLATSGDIVASNNMMAGEQPINFTHVVLQLNNTTHILAFMDLIFNSKKFSQTCIVIITDQAQQAGIIRGSPNFDYNLLQASQRLHFLLKPSKPPKFAKIFDPKQENDLSRDHSRANRVESIGIQRQAFKKFEDTLSNRGIKVLAVEDNKLNMKMLTHFLHNMCGLEVIEAWDGEECTKLVFSHEPLYYSVIICDIQMPNKDGYATCREIRSWEEKNGYPHVPMIALSANIMAEGQRDSAAAGFTQYTTKPVEWSTLGNLLIELVDRDIPHVFLKDRLATMKGEL